jgi:hypothetical protein
MISRTYQAANSSISAYTASGMSSSSSGMCITNDRLMRRIPLNVGEKENLAFAELFFNDILLLYFYTNPITA